MEKDKRENGYGIIDCFKMQQYVAFFYCINNLYFLKQIKY